MASPAVRQIIGRRLGELAGLGLGLAAIVFLLALVSYDTADPSLDTATAREASNLVGPTGAITADVLLQGFGLAGALPGVVMLGWAWRIASHRGLGRFGRRVGGLVLAMPVLAATLAAMHMPGPHGRMAWPVQAGPGGAMGQALGDPVVGVAHDILGPTGSALIISAGLLLSAVGGWAGCSSAMASGRSGWCARCWVGRSARWSAMKQAGRPPIGLRAHPWMIPLPALPERRARCPKHRPRRRRKPGPPSTGSAKRWPRRRGRAHCRARRFCKSGRRRR
jgi:hypothetical protein